MSADAWMMLADVLAQAVTTVVFMGACLAVVLLALYDDEVVPRRRK